ncbi:ROK family transcriptional regulator [Aquibacillus sp. 3ASR75-11]|uniref:ROK family transcriptional regulator n=1 Tax=Terrihalobacillus insolitus TaxID=2950438 RepID=A0A9X3WTN0_9BACI|nr:ROK family transcriptional regulator [Terrihalobacillus insolitus]MDC3412098.1 ROK family transcriptional regulator [Terrihalobacillus insolitus]MDC3423209.1 ROK family transcriptional regulator [Terrihalobacillus insolitus]
MGINQTWNQFVVKKGNKSLVLETIKECFPISRADIAQQTGLNKGTVSSLVNELLQEQLISESGPGESSGGRRPVMLHFNKVAGYSIGIDLGVNYLLGVLTDLEGNICFEKKVSYKKLSYEEIEKKLFQVIDFLISSAPPSPYGIVGIGVGVPGTVSISGEILLAPNLEWKNVQLQSSIEKKYDIPVTIENEANAGAYGEKKFGVGKEFDNIIYISAGIGIGVGLILNGKLYKGSNGFSGELGHMTIQVNGIKCRCGNEGCWELYASEQALLNEAEKLKIKTAQNEEVTLEDLIKLAENGDNKIIRLFEKIGDYLGVGVNNIINIFNPEQIIIGNRMAASGKWLKKTLEQRMITHTLWYQHEDMNINFSELSTHSSALGVSALTVEKFLNVDLEKKVLEI